MVIYRSPLVDTLKTLAVSAIRTKCMHSKVYCPVTWVSGTRGEGEGKGVKDLDTAPPPPPRINCPDTFPSHVFKRVTGFLLECFVLSSLPGTRFFLIRTSEFWPSLVVLKSLHDLRLNCSYLVLNFCRNTIILPWCQHHFTGQCLQYKLVVILYNLDLLQFDEFYC